jgi:hypothetical protein
MDERSESDTVQLKVRMKEPLRAALEEAARQRGVSLNSEVVRRLERSFEQEQRLEDVFGGIDVYRLMRVIAAIMDSAGSTALLYKPPPGFVDAREARWPADPYAYDQALQAGVHALEALRPPGDPNAPSGIGSMVASNVGNRTAQKMLDVLRLALADRPLRGDDQ